MTKVIAVANQKGGVGKTNVTANLGIGLAMRQKKVLLIDADAQGSLTSSLGWKEPDKLDVSLSTIIGKIMDEAPIEPGEGILHHEEGIDLMPANIRLSMTEVSLVNAMSRELMLRAYLKGVKGYDYVLIDCMPSLGMITVNALAVSDSVIIPVQPHYLSAIGMTQLLQSVNRVKKNINRNLKIDGVVLTMVEANTLLARDTAQLIRTQFGQKLHVFHAEIPRAIKAAEAPVFGMSVFKHAPNTKIADAYISLTREVESIGKELNREHDAHERR